MESEFGKMVKSGESCPHPLQNMTRDPKATQESWPGSSECWLIPEANNAMQRKGEWGHDRLSLNERTRRTGTRKGLS